MKTAALLVLQDGTIFKGAGLGAAGEAAGEIVFNTSMTGYQEILTDPSYKGQIVTMTYPLIGNYGVNNEDVESSRPWAEGFIVKESSAIFSNWRAKTGLDDYLKSHNIVGIEGIDTRALTRKLRTSGAMKGIISTTDLNENRLVQKAKDAPDIVGMDLVKDVTCRQPYDWEGGEKRFFVAAWDFGVKHNILRLLSQVGCRVKVMPARAKAEEIMVLKPDGLFLSNGPADPAAVIYVIEELKKILNHPLVKAGKMPIFGICLGHQLLGLAFGGKTYKLKFGHHGANHPVMDLETRKVDITAQNHGFAVDIDSIPDKNVILTHINLYDKTAEGLRHKNLPIFSVQYHPEAGPGPHDPQYLFNRFVEMMDNCK